MATASISVLEIKKLTTGNLKAFATISIAGKVTIYSVRIVQQPGQEAWVAMPQTESKSTNGGKSKWYPILEITDPDLKEAISRAVLSAWQNEEQV